MTSLVVLAYDGELDIAAALAALSAPVVTMTVDVGQRRDVHEARDRALDAGALRAHVVDAVDEFARTCVLPALREAAVEGAGLPALVRLAYPIVARRLVEAARLEGTAVVAHAGSEALTEQVHAIDPSLRVIALDLPLRVDGARGRHLLQRPVAAPASDAGPAANVEILFDAAIPQALNGVPLSLPELLESLALIGGHHGIGGQVGGSTHVDAPAAVVLDAAYRALAAPSGLVRLELAQGRHRVVAANTTPALVHHA